MKSKFFRQALVVAAFLALASSFSSCNRGYGCPSNFSMTQTAVDVAQAVIEVVK